MTRWRILATSAVVLFFTSTAHGQTYLLSEPNVPDCYERVELSMSLSGKLKLDQGGKDVALEETAVATHDFVERIVEIGAEGAATKAARLYKTANVDIQVDKDKLNRQLRPERMFVVAQRDRDGLLSYCPQGPLTREEIDAVDHFDTFAISGLLPQKAVEVGQSWTPAAGAVQALCHFQGLSDNKLVCTLAGVKDDRATITVAGSAAGIDLGATVSATVQASCRFDLKSQRVVEVQWKQKDERAAGPVSPASELEIMVRVVRTTVDPVNELSDVALVPIPKGAPPREMTDLDCKDGDGRYTLRLGRDWQFVAKTKDHAVWRLMDRGEFIAQASVAIWKKAEAGKHLTPDEIKSIVANAPGWEQETLIKAGEVTLPSGQWAYLVAGEGDLDGVRAVQYFYVVAGPDGDQAMLTFTATPAQSQKLGTRDLEFVHGFQLPGPQLKSGAGN
jgi:hypothetical protein